MSHQTEVHAVPPTSGSVPFVFAVDEAYCFPLAVAWQSLAKSNAHLLQDLQIAVLHDSLAPPARDFLLRHAGRLGLNVRLVPAHLPDMPYNLAHGGTRAHYLRLSLPDTFAGHERVVYMDADVVVLTDLRPLVGVKLDGHPLGAVRDPLNPTYETGRALPAWPSLGLRGDQEYFNSGVLVVDMPAAARLGIFDRAWEAVAKHPQALRLWDQDALNLAAEDDWSRLDPCWNTVPFSALARTPWVRYTASSITTPADLIAAEDRAAILHYVSPAKPWKGLLPAGRANEVYQRLATEVREADRVHL